MSDLSIVRLIQDVALKAVKPLIPVWRMGTVTHYHWKEGEGFDHIRSIVVQVQMDGETSTPDGWIPVPSHIDISMGDRVELRCIGTRWTIERRIGGEVPVGTIAPFAGNTIPRGWLSCQGQV